MLDGSIESVSRASWSSSVTEEARSEDEGDTPPDKDASTAVES